MFRVILLTIGLALVVANPNDKMHKCGRLLHGGLACCKKEITKPPPPSDDIKECFQMPRKPPSCDMEICIATKKGVASSDGTIDKKALADYVEKDFESDPALVDSIKEKCINGDISKYGKEDFCDLMKLKLCMDVEMIKSCDDWNDEGDCNGVKALAEECSKQYD